MNRRRYLLKSRMSAEIFLSRSSSINFFGRVWNFYNPCRPAWNRCENQSKSRQRRLRLLEVSPSRSLRTLFFRGLIFEFYIFTDRCWCACWSACRLCLVLFQYDVVIALTADHCRPTSSRRIPTTSIIVCLLGQRHNLSFEDRSLWSAGWTTRH